MQGGIVNINGNSVDSLIEQHRNIIDKCDELLNVMSEALPHGRNYLTAEDGRYHADRDAFDDQRRTIQKIKANHLQIAMRLFESRQGAYNK